MIGSTLDWKVLKIIINNSSKGIDFAYRFDDEMFSISTKKYAKIVINHIKSYKTLPTKYSLTKKCGDEELVSKLFDTIMEVEANDNDLPIYIEEMVERYQQRMIATLSDSIIREGVKVSDLILDSKKILGKAASVNNGRSYIQRNIADYDETFYERYNAIESGEVSPGIKTGYRFFDEATNGMRPGEWLIIGGESNAGKSILLSNMARQMWLQSNRMDTDTFVKGNNILYFSLEMPYDDCYDRLMAQICEIPQKLISSAKLNQYQKQKLDQGIDFLKRYQRAGNYFNMVDVPRGVTIQDVELRFEDALLEFRPDVVVIDYLGIMNDPDHDNDPDWLKLSHISASCHEMARSYNIAALSAVQLTDIKRQGKKDGAEGVGMHRIGRSSQIIHHANFGIQIETRYQEEIYPDMPLHLVKNRRGPKLKGNLLKQLEYCLLSEMEEMSTNCDVDKLLETLRS